MRTAIIAIFSLLFLASVAVASEVELTLFPDSMVGYAGETSSIDLIIKNNQISADTFTITFSPYQFPGVNTTIEKFLVWINSSSTGKVKLYFTISMDAEEVTPLFTISVKSTSNDRVFDEKIFFLRIVRKTEVYISELKLEKSQLNAEDTAKIKVIVNNIGKTKIEKYKLETTVEKDGNVLKRYDDIIEISPLSFIEISKEYYIGKYDAPGPYGVESVVTDTTGKIVSTKAVSFDVKPEYKIPSEYTTKNTSYNFFFITTIVTIKNEGNINTPSFYITESVPTIGRLLFNPDIEPTETIKTEEGRIIYKWLIPTLEPGKQITIKYSYDLWKVWITIFILITAGYFGIKFFYSPKIIKRHGHKGPITKEKEILVSLEVKNRTMHEVKEVQIRDIVPSIAKVVEKFDTLKPMMRTTSVGTELRWKIDSLKPGEERIITYRIKPVVEVTGSLNLPKAHARYIDRKQIKRIIASKSVLIK